MKVIGITGGIGAGKSRILDYLRETHQARVYEADKEAARLQEKGGPCFETLVETFGSGILDGEGNLDREALARLVFGNRDRLARLNAIVHPAVREDFRETLEACRREGVPLLVIEAALLVEEGYQAFCDSLWYIHVPASIRQKRLMESRGYDEEKIRRIMASQLGDEEFRRACQVVIDNSGPFQETIPQIEEALL